MKALESLFVLESIETIDGGYRFTLQSRMDSIIYQAHFPNNPITPGACLVQVVGELIENISSLNVELITVKNIKFMSMIVPKKNKRIIYDIQMDWNSGKANVIVGTDNKIYSKMSLLYHIFLK